MADKTSVPAPPPREHEILMLIAAGHGNKQIPRLLTVSDTTVESHRGRLFQRLGVTDRTQAAIGALQNLTAMTPGRLHPTRRSVHQRSARVVRPSSL
jgi:DNA-binding NarL/FixJ family response regulator